jgi:bifunctional NMN adenylyltransferase/nudix hydrolase
MSTHSKKDLAVCIGRFQPFHNGHLALLEQAFATAGQVIVVIGSARQARTPRNPFTWQERVDMIRLALPEAEQARVAFLPVRDERDDDRWFQAIHAGVDALGRERTGKAHFSVVWLGRSADMVGADLSAFEGWDRALMDERNPADASHIRDVYFGQSGDETTAVLKTLSTMVPSSTLQALAAQAALPVHAELAGEWRMLRKYKEAWSAAPYPPVFVTVDAVVQCADKILLIRRGQPPGVGLHALPGGFIEQNESAYQSAVRELREETRLSLPASTMKAALKGSAVFDQPARSQRGRTISHTFHFDLGDGPLPTIEADDDAQSADWVDIRRLADMEDQFHDDHFQMLGHFLGLVTDGPR